jgi:hypothetical protein
VRYLFSKATKARLVVFAFATTLSLLIGQAGQPDPQPSLGSAGGGDFSSFDPAPPSAGLLVEAGPAAGIQALPARPLALLGEVIPRPPVAQPRPPRRPAVSAKVHHRRHRVAGDPAGSHRAGSHRAGSHPGQAGRAATDRGVRRHVAVREGRDISWPQCPPNVGIPDLRGLALPMPEPGVDFVIVGLTNGRAFTPNPCLDRHLGWIRRHHVWASAYAFTTYPTRAELKRFGRQGPYRARSLHGRLSNAGYAAAQYNIRTMQRHGFATPHVWLDIEASSSRPWSRHGDRNRAVVKGWLHAYRTAGYRVGFYSTIHIWEQILGRARFGLPEWRTAGPDTAAAALGRCRERSFQGGPAVVAQWWTSRRDYDRMCPGHGSQRSMETYFHRY